MTGKAFEEAQKRFVSSVVHKSEKCVYMSPLSASTPNYVWPSVSPVAAVKFLSLSIFDFGL